MFSHFRHAALPALIAALAGCPGENAFDVTPTDATLDDVDARPRVDTGADTPLPGRVCQRDGQCDDGVECTDDRCGSEGRCVNTAVHARCDDAVYCNGAELCDTRRGCTQGQPVNCSDNDVCTADRCVEATRTCEHRPLDRDGDGDPDDHCAARNCGDAGADPDGGACWVGGDCDDSDPRVSSLSPEICGDGIDNNCNGHVDTAEPGGCRRAAHDRCDDPLDVSAGGVFALDFAGVGRDYRLPCLATSRDMVARLRLTEPRDVVIEGSSSTHLVALALQRVCGGTDAADTLACERGLAARIERRSLPPGEYFVVVGQTGDDPVDLEVRLGPATPPPTNDACATAEVLPGPGAYRGSTVGLADDVRLRCNAAADADAVYQFTTTRTQDVTATLSSAGPGAPTLALLSRCEPAEELRCSRSVGGAAPFVRARSLPPGTYHLVAETGRRAADFDLSLRFDPPSAAPIEDACPATEPDPAVEIGDGAPRVARMTELENDYTLSCNAFRHARDAVFRLTLGEPGDVQIRAAAAAGQTAVSLRAAPCAAAGSERRCVASTGGSSVVEFSQRALPAGTHWLIVENANDADVTVTATVRPPSPVVTYALTESPPGVAWVDACALPGAQRILTRADDATAPVPAPGSPVTIPFPLQMYGVAVTPPVAVSTNGWVSLSATTSVALTGRIPDGAEPNLTIAPLWTDTFTRAAGVCYAVTGAAPDRRLVVQWEDLHLCCSDDPTVHLSYEVVIHEAAAGANNVIDVVYQRLDGLSRTAAAGIENDDGSDGVTIPAPLVAPRAVRFTPSR